jgi:hypothetical protein
LRLGKSREDKSLKETKKSGELTKLEGQNFKGVKKMKFTKRMEESRKYQKITVHGKVERNSRVMWECRLLYV